MALKSSEARAQKRNKTKSVIIFKSRGHTGIIISFKCMKLICIGCYINISTVASVLLCIISVSLCVIRLSRFETVADS